MTLHDRKNRVLLLQLKQSCAEVPKKLIPRRFQQIQIPRVIDMVAEGTIGISHAMNVTENLSGHAAHCSGGP